MDEKAGCFILRTFYRGSDNNYDKYNFKLERELEQNKLNILNIGYNVSRLY